jgi:hypothetical protein
MCQSSLNISCGCEGFKGEEVTGEWRKLHNEELNDLYHSPSIVRRIKSRRMRWAGHVARMEERRGVYRVLVGKPEVKSPLGRPRRIWEYNINLLAPKFYFAHPVYKIQKYRTKKS